jgi:soluble cytochrome b562
MAHITLSIPDELFLEMKKHNQIKWSEVARRGIKQQLMEIKGIRDGQDVLAGLLNRAKKLLEEDNFSLEQNRKWYKEVKKKEKKRVRSLMQVP